MCIRDSSALLRETALACQTPLGALAGQNAPYDMLADNIRGFLNVPMDLYEIPEKVTAAIDIMTEYALQNVRRLKNTGSKYCFMPVSYTHLKFVGQVHDKVVGLGILGGLDHFLLGGIRAAPQEIFPDGA